MLLTAASSVYGAATRWRRAWYGQARERRRRLERPVVSVGNLRVGGSGKTPTVAFLARLLQARGERPAILMRGYARARQSEGVTVVSNGDAVLVGIDRAGDEALMLARALPGVPVLVGASRFLSGVLAERQLGATVHLLDDGFQHVALERDVDLLLAGEDDLTDRVLPAGRLREPLTAAASADALLAAVDDTALARLQRALGIPTAFRVRRALGALRQAGGDTTAVPPSSTPLLAVAGIARPERFVDDLRAAGYTLAGVMPFGDHHLFSAADVRRIVREAHRAGAAAIVTTEKDGVRLEKRLPLALPVLVVPLEVSIEPVEVFTNWLLARIRR